MALVNFKKGLLTSLPSNYVEGTFYVTTDERAIYLDVADDKRIRLGDFQEFADLAALEANENPSTTALYYITDGNILAKWDGTKYVQINVQKTLAELGGVSKDTFDSVIYDKGEGAAKVKGLISKVADLETTVGGIVSVGGEANIIEAVKVNGVELTVTDKAVDVIIPTGALASKDKVEKADLAAELGAEIDNKVVKEEGKSLVADSEITKLASVSTGANKVEASETNGNIKIDGVETVVYTHPEKHAIDDVTGLQDALDAKVNVADYNTDKATFALKTEVESAIGSVHTHANKAELDKISDGDVEKWNAEIGAKALAEAAAVKTEVETALAGKVDKVEGKSLISDSEITRLAGVNNYDDTQVKADIAKKADTETMTTELGKKVDKVEGYSLVADTEIARLADVDNYDDTALAARVKTLEDNPYVLPEDVVRDNDLTVYRTSADQDVIDNEIKGRIDVVEDILNDKTEGEVTTKGLVSRVEDLEAIDHDQLAKDASAAAVATVLDGAPEKFDTLKEIAAWIAEADTAEDAASLVTRVATIEDDYLKGTDKTELEGKINAINDHSHTFVESELNEIKAGDVAKWNAEIGANELAASKTTTAEVKDQIEAYGYATTGYADQAEADAKAYADTEVAKDRARLDTLEAIDHNAYKAYADQAEADAKSYTDTALTWGTF